MILTSTTETVPFTPAWLEGKANAPVFHLRAGSAIERGQMEAELAGPLRAGRVYGYELRMAIRAGVEMLLDGDPEQGRVLDIIDADANLKIGEQLPAADADLLEQVRRVLAEHWEPYRELMAQVERRRELAPIVALRRFCTGWDNATNDADKLAVYERGRDELVTDAALKGLAPLELAAAGNRAFSLQYVDEDDAKNSQRASLSGESQTTSPSRAKSKAAGSSTVKRGRRTPASRSPRGSGKSSTSTS